MKKALITGIAGQDGSYLAELLLSKGYEVHGLVRRTANPNAWRIEHIKDKLTLHEGNMSDGTSLYHVIGDVRPAEVYNLAAQSFVGGSFKYPEETADVDAIGVLRILEAIRRIDKGIKLYQASTSEMMGGIPETAPQNEETAFHPKSPYGVSKLFGHWMVRNYVESYGIKAWSAILYNHESPRRGREFVTRKITSSVAKIKLGQQDTLFLGNLEAKRDWGFAPDYVEGMWRMLQQDKPDYFILATGETHTVREFCEKAFGAVDLDYNDHVKIDPKFYRPAEVDLLWGNPDKAKRILGWEATTKFEDLVKIMVERDLYRVQNSLGDFANQQ